MRFVFKPGLLVAVLIAEAILISLGVWQLQRLSWKRDLIEKTEARVDGEPIAFEFANKLWGDNQDADYLPVVQSGVFRHDLEVHVFGTLGAKPGYYVFTPLAPSDSSSPTDMHVYVNRGFTPQDLKAASTRADGQVEGEVVVKGLFRAPEASSGIAGSVRPADDPDANVWHQRSPAVFADEAGIKALPTYIDSLGDENPGEWPKGGTTRLTFTNRHMEYALTWFGLALTLAGVYAAFSIKRD